MDDVLRAYGLNEADLLGKGWESQIYALGKDRILKIPNPDPGAEGVVRAQQAFALPPLPFAVPRVREITRVGGTLITPLRTGSRDAHWPIFCQGWRARSAGWHLRPIWTSQRPWLRCARLATMVIFWCQSRFDSRIGGNIWRQG